MTLRRLPVCSAMLVLCLGWGYYATLLPGIGYFGDTIKFQYVGKVLGIPHAPGYPLYLMLNHLFVTLFPFGSTAYRANLLSAVYAVGGCLVLFQLLRLLGTGRFVALVAALTFGFSQGYWSQAVIAEVYSLHILFVASASFFLVRWHLRRHDRDFYITTALYALSFGNHLLTLTLLPAFVYLVTATNWRVFVQPRKVFWVLFVVALGALQYGYLFWRLSSPQTPYIEGFNGQNFFSFVTDGPFKPQMFAFTPAQVLTERLPLFLAYQNTAMLGLAVVGAVLTRPKLRFVRTFLLVYFLSNALYAVNYDIFDIEVYFLPNDFVVAVFGGLALGRLARCVPPPSTWALSLLLLLPVTFYTAHDHVVDQSGNTGLTQRVEKVLAAVRQDALIVTTNYLDRQAFLYYLVGEGWGAERNLHTVGPEWALNRLRAYLEQDEALPTRSGLKAGLRVYGYPCKQSYFRPDAFAVTWPEPQLPELCRVEALSATGPARLFQLETARATQ